MATIKKSKEQSLKEFTQNELNKLYHERTEMIEIINVNLLRIEENKRKEEEIIDNIEGELITDTSKKEIVFIQKENGKPLYCEMVKIPFDNINFVSRKHIVNQLRAGLETIIIGYIIED